MSKNKQTGRGRPRTEGRWNGSTLRALRISAGYTSAEQLAEDLTSGGFPASGRTLRHWENDDHVPPPEAVTALATLLHVSEPRLRNDIPRSAGR